MSPRAWERAPILDFNSEVPGMKSIPIPFQGSWVLRVPGAMSLLLVSKNRFPNRPVPNWRGQLRNGPEQGYEAAHLHSALALPFCMSGDALPLFLKK